MPYIPPPPRPPTPPRPIIPTPPRIPQQNFHFQNQQRIQQQQQQFHQRQIKQQQQRFHQQQQQSQQRLQNQLQMDHQRRQQALQQQQQHFQRQQEIFRQQQQDEQRRRQDQLRRDEEHRRQQQLLRNLHQTNTSSSASAGVGEGSGYTVVNVSPGVTLEMNGLAGLLNGSFQQQIEQQVQLEASGQHVQMEVNGQLDASAQQPAPTPPPASAPPLSPNATPNTAYEAPPPYQPYPQGAPPTGPPPSQVPPPSVPVLPGPQPVTPDPVVPAPQTQQPPSSSATVIRPSVPPENRVVLKDGTQIIIQQEDEILFVGPTGVQMIVNCMPLYMPPEDALKAAADEQNDEKNAEGSSEATGNSKPKTSPKQTRTASSSSNPLRKAKSLTSIAITELELSDEERKTQSDDEILEDTPRIRKRKKSTSFGQHFSVKIHHQVSNPPTIEETDAAPPITHTDKDIEHPVQGSSDTFDAERLAKDSTPDRLQAAPESKQEGSKTEPEVQSTEQAKPLITLEEVPEAQQQSNTSPGDEVRQKSTKETVRKVNSTGSMPDFDDASDPEDHKDGLQVNYLNTTSTLPRLKRSSGSVSFPQNPIVQVTIEASPVPEENEPVEGVVDSKEHQPVGDTQQTTPTKPEASANVQQDTPKAEALQQETQKVETSADTQQDTPKAEALAEAVPSKLEASADALPPKEGAALPTAPPPSSTPSPQARLTATLLPPSPVTMDGDYVERSGWLTKLSHRKGMFGDKWQKRYFVLHRSWLYYFKKYGDSNPKGVVRLLPTGWSKPIPQGTLRMADAVITSSDKAPGIMSVLRCLAVHRPNNFAASLSGLLGEDGVAEAFRSQTVSVSSPQHSSRTFYMTAPSNDERDAWVAAVNKNIKTYSYSAEALTTATKELKSMLRAVKSTAPPKDIPSLLLLLHTKMRKIAERAVDP